MKLLMSWSYWRTASLKLLPFKIWSGPMFGQLCYTCISWHVIGNYKAAWTSHTHNWIREGRVDVFTFFGIQLPHKVTKSWHNTYDRYVIPGTCLHLCTFCTRCSNSSPNVSECFSAELHCYREKENGEFYIPPQFVRVKWKVRVAVTPLCCSRAHRLPIEYIDWGATFSRTFSYDGIFGPACWG
jgi:hypothetical protein